MTTHRLKIETDHDRRRAHVWVDKCPDGTRLEFKVGRTLPQNDRMWAMLADVAVQKDHCGRKYSAEQWKVLFMHACGREVKFLPALDGETFVPWGQSSRSLSKEEMSELIAFIEAWGVQNGVEFHDEAAA